MNLRRQRLALFCGWLLLPAAATSPATADVAAAGSSALGLSASGWVFPGRPLTVTFDQRGPLAGRHLAVYLFVDQNQFARLTTAADRTQATVPLPPLSAGRHLLVARSGMESAQTEFRVVPWAWLALALLGGFAISGLLVALRHRRRLRAA